MDDARSRIAAIPWFARLDAPVRDALVGKGRVQQRAAGEWVHGEGDEDTGVLAVLDGCLHLHSQSPDGGEVLFDLLLKGGVIGQSIVFGGGPRLVTAICATDAQLFLLPDHVLRETAAVHPSLWQNLSALAYQQLREMIRRTAEFVALKPRERVITRLLALSRFDNPIPVSQAALAEMVGVGRDAANRWLGELEGAGVVKRRYGRIEVVDRTALRRLASGTDHVPLVTRLPA